MFKKKNNKESELVSLNNNIDEFEDENTNISINGRGSIIVKEDYDFVLEYIKKVTKRNIEWIYLTPSWNYHGSKVAIRHSHINAVFDMRKD